MFFSKINPDKIKVKNTKLLRSQGIDVIEHLPHIDLTDFQSAEAVAKRCVVLAALLQLHFGAPNDFIKDYLLKNNLFCELSDDECERLEKPYEKWEEQDKTDLYWSIEAIWAITWAGNRHNNLTFNTGVGEALASYLPNFQENESAQAFIESFSLRSKKEIFSTLDSFYRAHWFARNISLVRQKSELVDLDIIMERRKALEWICNIEENWDNISLDT